MSISCWEYILWKSQVHCIEQYLKKSDYCLSYGTRYVQLHYLRHNLEEQCCTISKSKISFDVVDLLWSINATTLISLSCCIYLLVVLSAGSDVCITTLGWLIGNSCKDLVPVHSNQQLPSVCGPHSQLINNRDKLVNFISTMNYGWTGVQQPVWTTETFRGMSTS